jgi:hypothetical protein
LIACEGKGFQSLPATSDEMQYRASAFITEKIQKMQEIGAPEPPLPLLRSLSSFLF